MKKKLLLVLIFLMLFSKVYAYSEKFTDIDKCWAKEYIEKMSDSSLIKGYEDNTFRPDNNILNVEVYTIVNRLKNFKSHEDIEGLNKNVWYYEELKKANSNGYAKIDENFKIMPIKRLEMIEIISKIYNIKSDNDKLDFRDLYNIKKSDLRAISGLVEKGLIKGYGDNTLRLDENLTRAEFVKIIVMAEEMPENRQKSVIKVYNETSLPDLLGEKINDAKKIELNRYTEKSSDNLQRVIVKAENILKSDYSLNDIKSVITELENAMKELAEKDKEDSELKNEDIYPKITFNVKNEDDDKLDAKIFINNKEFKNGSELKPGKYYVVVTSENMLDFKTYLIVSDKDKIIDIVMEEDSNKIFKLNLSEGLICYQGSKFKLGERVTVDILIPNGKSIEEFVVNGEKKELFNNQYNFFITEDTDIKVTFK